jgi:3D (Asp-Asp-Asp) domain-containing protein/phage tail protein X
MDIDFTGKGFIYLKTKRLLVLLPITAILLLGTYVNQSSAENLKTVKVHHGDTLYGLARKYHLTVEQIAEANQITNPALIHVGQQLKIPILKTKTPIHTKKDSSSTMTSSEVSTFSRGKVLGSFTLTAYTSGYESTGKKPNDPFYGITSSGEPVQDGVTVAVDPKVIPIGSRVYIEGIGYRIAQDVGGAIKGKRIDVYISDLQSAQAFGVQHGKQVELVD